MKKIRQFVFLQLFFKVLPEQIQTPLGLCDDKRAACIGVLEFPFYQILELVFCCLSTQTENFPSCHCLYA